MSDVPSDVIREILLRLPVDSLLCFRAVSKEWRGIIDDPSFTKSHANNQLSSTTLLIRNSIGTRLYSLTWDSLNFDDGQQTIDVTPVKTLYRTSVPRIPPLPVASCNGLILISHYRNNKIWVIWNPLTREFHDLPKPDISRSLVGSGLGYNSASDDYKVVKIHALRRQGKDVYRTCVYSLKLDSWRIIEDCPRNHPHGNSGVFLNDALHWRSWDMIIALDLSTGNHRKMALPPSPGKLFHDHLDALGGYLVLSYYDNRIRRMDGWVMKDYGVEKSWMKLFSFGEVHMIGAFRYLRPIAYLKSKGQVILQHDNQFIWLDIEKDSVKKVTIHGLPDDFTSQIFPGTLFRLDGRVAVAAAGMKKKRKNANTSLKHSVTITEIPSNSDSS